MQALLSVCYLIECSVIAAVITRATPASGPDLPLFRFLVWWVIFFTAFFGGFHILGYVNLATNLPMVNIHYAAAIGFIAVCGACTWCAGKKPGLLHARAMAGDLRSLTADILGPQAGLGKRLAIITFLIFAVVTLMLLFGYPRGYEATAYHLPIAAHTFQSQSLKIWDASFMHTYPANASLYFGYLLGFVPEHWVSAANLIFLIPLSAAVYALGRATGGDEVGSVFATLGLVTIPIVGFSAFEATADLGGITFLAVGLYFATAQSGPLFTSRLLSGFASGLAFGFKSLHLMNIVVLFTVALLQDWRSAQSHAGLRRFRKIIQPATVFSVAILATATFWLVRNYVQLGNPLYPVYLSIFDLFHWTHPPDKDWSNGYFVQLEWVRSSGEWFVYPWIEWHKFGENFKSSSGLGAFFATTVPVACVVTLVGTLRGEGKRYTAAPVLLGGGFSVLALWAYLNVRELRFAMGALVFLVPLVAAMISLTTNRPRRALEVVLTVCISCMLFVIFSKQLVTFGTNFIYADHRRRHSFYGYPEMVDRLPPGSTVVNFARRTLNYGLYGSTHQNKVISFREAFRILGIQTSDYIPEEAPEAAHLTYSALKSLGATHIVTEGTPRLLLDQCTSLEQLDQLDKVPGIETPLPRPFILYAIKYCA
jgi:hypothetical protein